MENVGNTSQTVCPYCGVHQALGGRTVPIEVPQEPSSPKKKKRIVLVAILIFLGSCVLFTPLGIGILRMLNPRGPGLITWIVAAVVLVLIVRRRAKKRRG